MKGATRLALERLALSPCAAWQVGHAVWPDSKRNRTSNGGGGDYAAQMLLGRLRKRGYVRTQHTEGSSVWELTERGRAYLAT